jgi:translation elongation factor EF-Ts
MTADVDMSMVKKLRAETGIGILECKKAIIESKNNF